MKFLKTQNLSRYGVTDNVLRANPFGRYIMDGTGALRLPKGTTNKRPQLTGVSTPEGANGYIRYNTTTNELEDYISGDWETVRASGSNSIIKHTLGPGDYVETIFGPLLRTPPIPTPNTNFDFPIIVLIENVIQISETNYNLLYNYQGTGDTYIQFESPVPLDKSITIYFGFGD
jgi:hypothetical protein